MFRCVLKHIDIETHRYRHVFFNPVFEKAVLQDLELREGCVSQRRMLSLARGYSRGRYHVRLILHTLLLGKKILKVKTNV